MPRSEKFYTFFLVGLMSVIVIASLVAGISSLGSKDDGSPQYEANAPQAFVASPEDSIADQSNTDNFITDEDFLLFHKTTRQLSPTLLQRGPQEAKQFVYNRAVIDRAAPAFLDFLAIVRTETRTNSDDVAIDDPQLKVCDLQSSICVKECKLLAQTTTYLCNRAQSSTSVSFVGRNPDGSPGQPTTIRVYYDWLETKKGWKIVAITPQVVSLGDNSGTDNSETPPATTTNTDPSFPVG